MLCIILAQCWIEAQAYSANRSNQSKNGYVKLNGVAVWQASWEGEFKNRRGVNVIIVDPSTCTMQDSRNFDTYGDSHAADQLCDYLQGLSDGTILVGVSCDEASEYLSNALPALSALGADVSDVEYRGAWVFVAEKGNPDKTKLDKVLTEEAANDKQPYVTTSSTGA